MTAPVDPSGEQADGQLRGRFGLWEFPIVNRLLGLAGSESEDMGLGVSSMIASAGHMNTGVQSNAAHSSSEPKGIHIY